METKPTELSSSETEAENRTDSGPGQSENDRESDAWWSILGLLYRRRRFVMVVTGLVAVASIVISLFLPKWYESTARVIIPSGSSGGGLGALLGDLNPAAAALLGGSGGDYLRYMAILQSRTMFDLAIDEFNLMDVYDTRDSKTPLTDTREELESNVDFEIDREFDFLAMSVLDTDPQRATDMTNFFVDELNRMNVRLTTESASNYRRFVERRYNETLANLDSAMIVLQAYQEKYGIVGLEQQTQALLETLALYRAATFEVEIEYEGLVLDFGENNPMVRSARNRVDAAHAKEKSLLEGNDPLMPVAFSELPEIARGWASALREVMIFEKIIEFARPLLEQAIFEEQKEAPAVQVLDRAVVPEWKTKPKRALIVLGATFSALILVVLYLLSIEWFRRNRMYLKGRVENDLTSLK